MQYTIWPATTTEGRISPLNGNSWLLKVAWTGHAPAAGNIGAAGGQPLLVIQGLVGFRLGQQLIQLSGPS